GLLRELPELPDRAKRDPGRGDFEIASDTMNGVIVERLGLIADVRAQRKHVDVEALPARAMRQLKDELLNSSIGVRLVGLKEVQNS
ncbi:hypothetical protein ABTM01_20175, partial [Acinetobacter baumannii]